MRASPAYVEDPDAKWAGKAGLNSLFAAVVPPKPAPAQALLVWAVLFLICLGLGYPTLNRYDPGSVNPDAATYSRLVTAGPGAVDGHMRFRVLVRLLARPFYRMAQGRVGSWNPVFAGLLVANLGRAMFSIAGPLLSLSAALLLAGAAGARSGDIPAVRSTGCE
jgi:hypothetical protein